MIDIWADPGGRAELPLHRGRFRQRALHPVDREHPVRKSQDRQERRFVGARRAAQDAFAARRRHLTIEMPPQHLSERVMAKKAAKKLQRTRQAPALSPQGSDRRADDPAAAGAAGRDLRRPARHPQKADGSIRDLDARARIRRPCARARRACALQDHAVAPAIGDRHCLHRAKVEGAVRVARARADGLKAGVKPETIKEIQAGRVRSRRRRTSARSTISSTSSIRPAASATKGTSASTTSSAPGHRRIGRHLRLLRDDLDDAQRISRPAPGGRAAAVPGARLSCQRPASARLP